jgi:hypothetical protein
MLQAGSVTLVPYAHGKLAFCQYIRDLCLRARFDHIAVDLPSCLEQEFFDAVADLPHISAVIAHEVEGALYYASADPCDAAIEALRQSRQNNITCSCIGHPKLERPSSLPSLPDEYAISRIGFDAYATLCLRVVENNRREGLKAANSLPKGQGHRLGALYGDPEQYIAHRVLQLKTKFPRILVLVHLSRFAGTIFHLGQEKTCNLSFSAMPSYTVTREFVNPDHLYFTLGELPFVTGKFERERYDPFSPRIDVTETVKTLFTETRDEFHDKKNDVISLSPARIQCGLTFLRNLTVSDSRFVPTLFDIIVAAKGIGGNSYALHILNNARYYPFLPFELDSPLLSVGIGKITLPGATHPRNAIDLFRDTDIYWRTLSIRMGSKGRLFSRARGLAHRTF